MKKFLLNTIYKMFIVVTAPIALLEIIFKNLWYCVQLCWWDCLKEFDFIWKSLKWGLWKDRKEKEERIKRMTKLTQKDNRK